jgi:hypothetical protein
MVYRSWPCLHPRGSRLRPRLRLTVPSRTRPDDLPTSSHGVVRPSDAPSPGNPLPDTRFAKTRLPKKPNRLDPCLVAGFPETRFGPPSPFSTTLTVYASPNPVIYFNHSRPWGWCSRLPVRGRNRDAEPNDALRRRPARPRGGTPAKGSRTKRRPGRFSRPGSRSTAPTAETMGPAPAPLYIRSRPSVTRFHQGLLPDLHVVLATEPVPRTVAGPLPESPAPPKRNEPARKVHPGVASPARSRPMAAVLPSTQAVSTGIRSLAGPLALTTTGSLEPPAARVC